MENIPIPVNLANALLAYLAERKWKEVANLIAGIDAAARAAFEKEKADGVGSVVEPVVAP